MAFESTPQDSALQKEVKRAIAGELRTIRLLFIASALVTAIAVACTIISFVTIIKH